MSLSACAATTTTAPNPFRKSARVVERAELDNLMRRAAESVVEEFVAGQYHTPAEHLASMSNRLPKKVKYVPGPVPELPTVDGVTKAREMMAAAFDEFFRLNEERWAAKARGEDPGPPILFIIKTDTGVGKNHGLNEKIIEHRKAFPTVFMAPEDGPASEAGFGRPIFVMAGPNYALDGEIAQRLRQQGGEDAPSIGFHEGKARAGTAGKALDGGDEMVGCLRAECMKSLTDAGMSSANLCKSRDQVKHPDGTVTYEQTLCHHFDVCPAMKQRQKWNADPLGRGTYVDGVLDRTQAPLEYEDICFTVHALGDKPNAPHLVKHPRAVIIDEDICKNMLHEGTFPVGVIEEPCRRPPKLSKEEKQEGVTQEGLMADYDAICGVAFRAMTEVSKHPENHECPVELMIDEVAGENSLKAAVDAHRVAPSAESANRLLNARADRAKAIDKLLSDVKAAKRVCSSDNTAAQAYGPNSSDADIARAVAGPRGKFASIEWRMWAIVEERLKMLKAGEIPARDDETRISIHRGEVWVAWRSEILWPDSDMLILDASADEEIVEALLPNHDVRYIDCSLSADGINSSLPQHAIWLAGMSCANGQFFVPGNSSADVKRRAAEAAVTAKAAVDAVACIHPGQQILACATVPIEKRILGTLVVGQQVTAGFYAFGKDVGFRDLDDRLSTEHYGNLRGKDAYKNASAVLCLGQLNPPGDPICRRGIALSYDKPRRTFTTADGNRYVDDVRTVSNPKDEKKVTSAEKRRLRARKGGYFEAEVYTRRNWYERMIQRSMREEEIVQAAGRTRAALRNAADETDWAYFYYAGNCPPENFIYDEVIAIHDIGRNAEMVSLAAMNGGAIWPGVVRELQGLVPEGEGDGPVWQKSGSDWLRRGGMGRDMPTPLGWAKVSVGQAGGGQPICMHIWLASVPDGVPPEEAAIAEYKKRYGTEPSSTKLLESNPLKLAPLPTAVSSRPSFDERAEMVADAMEEAATMLDVLEKDAAAKGEHVIPVVEYPILVELALLNRSAPAADVVEQLDEADDPPAEDVVIWVDWDTLRQSAV